MSNGPLPQERPTSSAVHEGAVRIVDRALALLRLRRGVDFSGYRLSTMDRRLANRMVTARETDGDRYLALLAGSDREVDALIANLAIKVSRFYRNAAAFDLLAATVIPMLRERFADTPLRVWSAGCAFGEEAYSLAMLLRDEDRVDATDVDGQALETARLGRYGRSALGETPAALERAYLRPVDHGSGAFTVSDRLRNRVQFRQHDLVAEAGVSTGTYHLVCCRNVLIYFTRPLQIRAFRRLIESVIPGGVLCLGEAEWPIDELEQLEAVDRRNRIFRRRSAKESV